MLSLHIFKEFLLPLFCALLAFSLLFLLNAGQKQRALSHALGGGILGALRHSGVAQRGSAQPVSLAAFRKPGAALSGGHHAYTA